MSPLSFDDIKAAAGRIDGVVVRTPLLEFAGLNDRIGSRVFVKPENLQRSGSFKFRGAYNRLVQLSDVERQNGVVAWSSGNHAQGVAAAAQILDISATIVMPRDAPAVKTAKTKSYGADVVFYDRKTESREDIARAITAERGATLVPSFDDPYIMAGQGTCGFEIAHQAKALGVELSKALICTGGGGLIAGSSLALKSLVDGIDVYSVEPDDFDDHKRSLESGHRECNAPTAESFCDALLAPSPGELTFQVNRETLTAGLSVSDKEVAEAMRFAYSEMKLVVEPGGAVALAALLTGKVESDGRPVAIILSGGNVDPALYADVLTQA